MIGFWRNEMTEFENGDYVWVNLGGIYLGEVIGIAFYLAEVTLYIVNWIDKPENTKWSASVIPSSSLEKAHPDKYLRVIQKI